MTPTKRIAFVTYSEKPRLTDDDRLVLPHLANRGITVLPAVWNDKTVPWSQFDLVVLRSCWDYHHKPDEFRQFILELEHERIPLFNPAAVVKWNMDKHYLRDLSETGFRIAPTVWLEKNKSVNLREFMIASHVEKAVIKPTIGAEGDGTWLTTLDTADDDQSRFESALQQNDLMLQQFVGSVCELREWSLVFFNGKYSHSVLKKPKGSDFKIHGGSFESITPSPLFLSEAQSVIHCVPPCLYGRVDLVGDPGSQTMIMELELIEPLLYLGTNERASENFSNAIADSLAAQSRR